MSSISPRGLRLCDSSECRRGGARGPRRRSGDLGARRRLGHSGGDARGRSSWLPAPSNAARSGPSLRRSPPLSPSPSPSPFSSSGRSSAACRQILAWPPRSPAPPSERPLPLPVDASLPEPESPAANRHRCLLHLYSAWLPAAVSGPAPAVPGAAQRATSRSAPPLALWRLLPPAVPLATGTPLAEPPRMPFPSPAFRYLALALLAAGGCADDYADEPFVDCEDGRCDSESVGKLGGTLLQRGRQLFLGSQADGADCRGQGQRWL